MGGDNDTESLPCPVCQGRGWIVLLVSRSPCEDCQGSGISSDKFDFEENALNRFEDDDDTGSWHPEDS